MFVFGICPHTTESYIVISNIHVLIQKVLVGQTKFATLGEQRLELKLSGLYLINLLVHFEAPSEFFDELHSGVFGGFLPV